MNNNIEFVGFKKNPYKYMVKSKIFMLTSDWEGYGLVAYEALTLGLPCIVSNVGGLPNIVDNECGKLCNSNEDFIEETINLLSNSKIYNLKNKRALKKSELLENKEEYINKIKEIYNFNL